MTSFTCPLNQVHELGVVDGEILERLLDVAFEPDDHEVAHRRFLHRPGFPRDVRPRLKRVEVGIAGAEHLGREGRAPPSSLPA